MSRLVKSSDPSTDIPLKISMNTFVKSYLVLRDRNNVSLKKKKNVLIERSTNQQLKHYTKHHQV